MVKCSEYRKRIICACGIQRDSEHSVIIFDETYAKIELLSEERGRYAYGTCNG